MTPRLCAYPPCGQPVPETNKQPRRNRPRRYCSRLCISRDYERLHPSRLHNRPPRVPRAAPEGPCACGCGADLSTRTDTRIARRFASKKCARRVYYRRKHGHPPSAPPVPVTAVTPTAPARTSGDRYYDLKPEVIERLIAKAERFVRWHGVDSPQVQRARLPRS